MVLFIQIYMWFSIIIAPLNLIISILDLDVKFKACCVGIIVLDVLWAIGALVCVIIYFIC